MECEQPMSRSLPPEDIAAGQYVTVLHEVCEFLPWDCRQEASWRPVQPLRTLCLPESGGVPMKVIQVCLPFVLVERPNGRHRTLDVRRYKLARVSDQYGDEAFRRIRQEQDRSKNKRRDDDDDKDDG